MMDYNFYRLNKFDIIFLFDNLESLTLPTKTKLIINKDNIIDDLRNHLTDSEIDKLSNMSLNISISDKLTKLPIENRTNLLSMIIPMSSESIEDIVTIIKTFRNIVSKIGPKDSREIYNAFYKHVLKDKITVFSILQKSLQSNDVDEVLTRSPIKTIYSLWLSTTNAHVTAIATNMLYNALDINDESIRDFLIHSMQIMNDYGTDDIVHIIKQVEDSGLVEYDVPEADTDIKIPVEDVSENINIIGDNLFSDRPQFIHDLKNEIVKLDTDSIMRYIGYQDHISYTVNPQSLGYLIDNKDFLIAKVNIRDMGMYTIVKYEGILYLLFELGGNTIQGISFPVDAGGERKILAIPVDTNVKYSIKEPSIE